MSALGKGKKSDKTELHVHVSGETFQMLRLIMSDFFSLEYF